MGNIQTNLLTEIDLMTKKFKMNKMEEMPSSTITDLSINIELTGLREKLKTMLESSLVLICN